MENAGRNALLVEIRAHRVRQLLAPRQPPEAAQLPSSRVVGGYIKSTCSACLVATCWRKASEDEPQTVTCGACVKLGPLDMECGICGSLSARLPVPACHNDFCMGCLGKWICVQIEDGIAHPSCPMPGCGEALSEPVIKHLGKRGLLSDGHQRRLQELRNAGKRDVLRHVLSGEDPALTEWAMTSTQACPHCFALVQKSTGCNHITCSCKGEFCYICGVAYPLPRGHPNHDRAEGPTLNPQGVPVPDRLLLGEGGAEASAVGIVTFSTTDPLPRTTEEARARLSELQTLHCPRCDRGVHMERSFDACFALRCPSCPAHFCAWCLRPAAPGEDLHSHVLDCTEAPADMRGSALYLHDSNGGPHVPPHPHTKFMAHWRSANRRRAMRLIGSLPEDGSIDKPLLVRELDSHLCD